MAFPHIPIRWRLTLFYTALVALLLTLFSVFLYTTLTNTLLSELDNTLFDRAVQLGQTSTIYQDYNFDDKRYESKVNIPVDTFKGVTTFVQATDLEGHIGPQSENLSSSGMSLPVPTDVTAIIGSKERYYETVQLGDVRLRVLSTPVSYKGRPQFILQVARSTEDIDKTANRLSPLLFSGIIAAIMISLLAGHFLSGRGLRPIERVTKAASEIGAERDFSRRVPYVGPEDEVGRLASTFNTMLQELQEAYADVANALTAQRRFVADASHELRTPLTAIRGNAELLQRIPDMDPADRLESIDEMAREAQRMSRLINNLLALARADAGQELHKAVFPLNRLVEEISSQARHLSADIPVYLGPLSAVELYGDRDYVKQLLLILLDNALKYTRPGGWVAISEVQDGDHVTVSVEDTGIGIDPEHLPHIFERFYRADSSRSSQGTGLGLSIGRWIAEQHGATISVTSELNRGSVFSITFPLAPAQLPTADGKEPTSINNPVAQNWQLPPEVA